MIGCAIKAYFNKYSLRRNTAKCKITKYEQPDSLAHRRDVVDVAGLARDVPASPEDLLPNPSLGQSFAFRSGTDKEPLGYSLKASSSSTFTGIRKHRNIT